MIARALKVLAPHGIATIIVLLYTAVQMYVLTHAIIPEMRDIVMRSLGTLDASLGLVLSWYFGSQNRSVEHERSGDLAGKP